MITPNKYFDEIYCLNVNERIDRWENVSKLFKEQNINVNRIEAITSSQELQEKYDLINTTPKIPYPAFIILHSFLKIFEKIKTDKVEKALIFEDDVLFHKNFGYLFDESIRKIPSNWDIWFLGATECFGIRYYNDNYIPYQINDLNYTVKFFKKLEIVGNFAIAVKQTIVDEMIQLLKNAINKCSMGADAIVFNYLYEKYNVYVNDPFLCAHDYGQSDADGNLYTEDLCIKNNYYYRLVDDATYKNKEKLMNLHLCCGDVYLYDYINLDIVGRLMIKGEVNLNITNLDNYYKNKIIGQKKETIIDKRFSILTKWQYANNSIDNIVMICALEHFSFKEAEFIVSEAHRVLKHGGKFKIDVPDIKQTIEEYYDKDPEYCMTLIYCNHKDRFSVHNWGYSEETLMNLLGKDKWTFELGTIVKHDYPCIGITATKI